MLLRVALDGLHQVRDVNAIEDEVGIQVDDQVFVAKQLEQHQPVERCDAEVPNIGLLHGRRQRHGVWRNLLAVFLAQLFDGLTCLRGECVVVQDVHMQCNAAVGKYRGQRGDDVGPVCALLVVQCECDMGHFFSVSV